MVRFRYKPQNKSKMIKDFKTQNIDGRLIISKEMMGLGFHLNFIPATFERQYRFMILIDLLFIRFWLNNYKK